ncbi:MAG: quinone-dependent dihydroorotate dehydrogenase [Elusimicrobia bacterium]|nr:quinone-dependent dihydroorotate dehydrogenase [Elusimicrobiota bacterium]
MTSLYKKIIRPILFHFPPEIAHSLALRALKAAALPQVQPFIENSLRVKDPALRVTLKGDGGDLVFPNPVGLAAGFDKDAEALKGLTALGFGFLEAGTLTPKPQEGNPRPRLFRFPQAEALVNRMGFNNQGAASAAERLPLRINLRIPVGFNIGKNRTTPLEQATGDYLACMERLYEPADFFVINVSSPNTPGLRKLQAPEQLDPLLKAIKEKNDALALEKGRSRKPLLFVKISPDDEPLESAVGAAVSAGFHGIVATNTTRSREGLPPGAPSDGGMSGRPLRSKSTEVVRRLHQASRGHLTLIGVGGIFSAEDAYEKILAGASMVEVYTGFIYEGYSLVRDINRGLLDLLKRDGFQSVQDAIGKKA